MRRLFLTVIIVATFVLLLHAPEAQAQQAISFQLGGFVPTADGARVSGDVLDTNRGYLLFDIRDFKSWTGGVEWQIRTSDRIEFGVGANYYQKLVSTVYTDLVHTNGSDIAQDLNLRIVPVAATIKFLPLGSRSPIQPYIGVGVAVYLWKYVESGEFVDVTDIYRATYSGSGTAVGPVATFGLRAKVARQVDIGVELRGQWGRGSLSRDFLSDRIDLGGVNVLATLRFRY